MPTKEDLQQAIEKLEDTETSFEVCQKLATYYFLYDKYYNRIHPNYMSDSKFMEAVADISLDSLLEVMDELMECVAVINPKLHDSVLNKLRTY
jgi:arginyl-tRNA--protein-N-Asp/Glu arginylyltransferase